MTAYKFIFAWCFTLIPNVEIVQATEPTEEGPSDMNIGRSLIQTNPSHMEIMMEKLMLDVTGIKENLIELNYQQSRMSGRILEDIKVSCSNPQNFISQSSAHTKLSDVESIIDSSIEVATLTNTTKTTNHAIRCSSYRALHEFIPVEKVTSNDQLLEAGWDTGVGPLYFCHTQVPINGIQCRLYGKGNRRTCWVALPGGRVHWVTDKFHLLRKPEGVNLEWRASWPTDVEKRPVAELKTGAGVVYESAVWDIYTCGLAPRFYFGRCERAGVKTPGLIQSGEASLKYTFGGREQSCDKYEILVCTNK